MIILNGNPLISNYLRISGQIVVLSQLFILLLLVIIQFFPSQKFYLIPLQVKQLNYIQYKISKQHTNYQLHMVMLLVISGICGWIYFVCWAISFYGQIIENYVRKRVDGLSFELVYLNLFGFTYFSLFVTLGYFDKEYEADTGEVDIQDVFFGYHSLLLTIICLGQCFYYPRSSSKKIASWCFWMIVIMNTLLLIDYILQKINIVEKFAEFSVLRLLGYFKLIITIIKYIPQLYRNYKRKSTKGWNIHGVMLDGTGGIFALIQMHLDAIMNGTFNIFSIKADFNPIKFGLCIISIVVDTLFILQHFVLYKRSYKEALLGDLTGNENSSIIILDSSPFLLDYKKNDANTIIKALQYAMGLRKNEQNFNIHSLLVTMIFIFLPIFIQH